MKKYLTIDRIIMFILFIIVVSIKQCESNDYKNLLNLKEMRIDSLENIKGQKVYTSSIEITNNQKELKDTTNKIFKLKKRDRKKIKNVSFFNSTKTIAKIEDKVIPYVKDSTIKNDSSFFPRSVKDSCSEYIFEGIVREDSFVLKKIEIPDSQYIRITEIKKGLFKQTELRLEMLHTNKYIKNVSSNSILYKTKKKNKVPLYGIILIGGIILGKNL